MIHRYKLISIWLLSLLIVFMLTRATTPVKIVEKVKYITMTEIEYLNMYREVGPVEIIESKESSKINLGSYEVTAYCSCFKCCGKTDGITYSGVKAVEGVTIAADLSKIPLGSKVFIEGVGERTVQDKGGAIKGNKIDLYFGGIDGHEKALNFGRQTLKVWEVE